MAREKVIIRSSLQFIKKLLLSLLTAVAFYLVCALLFSLLPTHPPNQNCSARHEIFIASNGVHLDLILPVESIEPQFLQELGLPAGIKFVAFGWGDKDFYIHTPEWSDLTFPVAFKALFLKSETAMHVTRLPGSSSSWKRVRLCDWQLNNMNRYIKKSFKRDTEKNLIKMEFGGYSRYDSFYLSKGSFSLFNTCNIWVNKALKEVEIKTSVWSPFDFGVLYHLK